MEAKNFRWIHLTNGVSTRNTTSSRSGGNWLVVPDVLTRSHSRIHQRLGTSAYIDCENRRYLAWKHVRWRDGREGSRRGFRYSIASGSLHRDYHHISARHQRLIFSPCSSSLSFSPSTLGTAFSRSSSFSLPPFPPSPPSFSFLRTLYAWLWPSEKWPFVNYSASSLIRTAATILRILGSPGNDKTLGQRADSFAKRDGPCGVYGGERFVSWPLFMGPF